MEAEMALMGIRHGYNFRLLVRHHKYYTPASHDGCMTIRSLAGLMRGNCKGRLGSWYRAGLEAGVMRALHEEKEGRHA